MPKIYAMLETKYNDLQALVIKVEGIINNKPTSILIYLSRNFSYVSPWVAERCALQNIAHE